MKQNIQEAAREVILQSIERHGGLTRWNQVESILVEAYAMKGVGMKRRGLGEHFPMPKIVELRPKEGVAVLQDYPSLGRQSIYDNGKVAEIEVGHKPKFENDNHREIMLSVSRMGRPWTTFDATYFFGYAMLHYCGLPFSLLNDKVIGFKSRRSGDWRARIDFEYPKGAHTHSQIETLYFDKTGLLIRHDYRPEVSSPLARAANFLVEYDNWNGYLITKRRKVYFRIGRFITPMVVMDASIRIIDIRDKIPTSEDQDNESIAQPKLVTEIA